MDPLFVLGDRSSAPTDTSQALDLLVLFELYDVGTFSPIRAVVVPVTEYLVSMLFAPN